MSELGDDPSGTPGGIRLQEQQWWRSAVIYQVYPRSFADSDGDGIGDLPGLINRLDYLDALGIDAIWVTPCYPSPLNDGGYDVCDYRGIDPLLGDLDDIRTLIDQCHDRGIRVLMDIVPNHSSDQHPWFQELLSSSPGSVPWDRYHVRQGRGTSFDEPPNNWTSVFHGPAWSPIPGASGDPTGYWYLHLFDSTQPDFNWSNQEVRADFLDTLTFWFDLGIDGFRIDVAHGLVKHPELPDEADASGEDALLVERRTPYWDQDGVHEIYREWRAVADEYEPPRIFCGEAWVDSAERLSHYLRPDELHTSFNFDYLKAGWDASRLREVIDDTIATHQSIGAPPTWVLSNHDVVRHRTRLAPGYEQDSPDLEQGLLRALAATAFTLALPGSAYLYQGEELGLPEVDLPDEVRQDPAWHRSGGTDGFRDGCRVPIPWSIEAPGHGFGPTDKSWLPQPEQWAALSVARQSSDQSSTLAFYRELIHLRRRESAMGEGAMTWIPELNNVPEVLGIRRIGLDNSIVDVVLNLSDEPRVLPPSLGTEVLIASSSHIRHLAESSTPREELASTHLELGAHTCIWLRGTHA